MANLVGLAVARHAQPPFDVRRLGQGAAPRRMALYASRKVHSSVKKAAELLGLFCVVGTVGTVNTGATDDFPALADPCADLDLLAREAVRFGKELAA